MSIKNDFFKLVFPNVNTNYSMPPEVEIHARHDDTFVRMTPKITESEFDSYIDFLINELEHIRQEGKRKFIKAEVKLRE